MYAAKLKGQSKISTGCACYIMMELPIAISQNSVCITQPEVLFYDLVHDCSRYLINDESKINKF
jgi:hypothetical protein